MTRTTAEKIIESMMITIDGPAGSGKSTTAREVALRLNLFHIDTGAMYRAVTLKALGAETALDDPDELGRIADVARIEFVESDGAPRRVMLDGEDVTEEIRSQRVTDAVSVVSSHAPVRKAMVRKQRALADRGGVCLEGRDIGSVVLPSAHVKVYVDASVDVRAQRRRRELKDKGVSRSLEEVRKDIIERDRRDSTREVSPLRIPVGAQIIDTTRMSIDEQVDAVVATAQRVAERIAGLIPEQKGRNPFAKRRPYFAIWHSGALVLLKLIWGLRVVRKEKTDYTENFIYAGNHRSNTDPPIVSASIPREVYFVAKTSLFKHAPFRWMISSFNALPIRRTGFDRAAMDRFLSLIQQGKNILMFPEGSRSRTGQLGKAKAGIGFLALKSGCTVVPVYVEGSNRLRGAIFRRPHLTVIHGRPIRLTDPDISKLQDPDHFRDFGDMVMAAIQALRDEYYRQRQP